MDLAQLEVFLAVAREGRFSRAAEKLFRTQSAVSQTMHKLEQELGEPLLDRSSRAARLHRESKVVGERRRSEKQAGGTHRYIARESAKQRPGTSAAATRSGELQVVSRADCALRQDAAGRDRERIHLDLDAEELLVRSTQIGNYEIRIVKT